MNELTVAEERQARQRARAGLRYILPDRQGLVTAARAKPDGTHLVIADEDTGVAVPTEDTGLLVKGKDAAGKYRAEIRKVTTVRQEAERRKVKARRRAKLPPDDPLEPELVPAERALKRHVVKAAGDDALIERAAPLAPAYRTLVQLARSVHKQRGDFIEDYCYLLRDASLDGQAVSESELADLAARERYGWSVRTAYRYLAWSYGLFTDWCLEQYLLGHVFTASELGPMVVWLGSMNTMELSPDEQEVAAFNCG